MGWSKSIVLGALGLGLGLGLTACGHKTLLPKHLEVKALNEEARAALTQRDVKAARAHYQEVLSIEPGNLEALFGSTLAEALLLDQFPAIQSLLDLCNQPPFDAQRDLYGPGSILDRLNRRADGTLAVRAEYRPRASGAATMVDTQVRGISTAVDLPFAKGEVRKLAFVAFGKIDGFTLFGSVNIDDIATPADRVLPLAAGLEIAITDLAGSLSVHLGSRAFSSPSELSSGRLRFIEVGTGPSDRVVIEFVDVVLGEDCQGECAEAGSISLSGRLEDRINEDLLVDTSVLPFGAIKERLYPSMDLFSTAIEGCDPLVWSNISSQVDAIGDHLAELAKRLEPFQYADEKLDFTYVLPKDLPFATQDLTIGLADVLLLKGMLEFGAAGIELGIQYKTYEGSLQAMMETYCRWDPGPEVGLDPVCTEERGLTAFAIYENFSANLLDDGPAFDITVFRERLRTLLVTASEAFRADAAPGIFLPQERRTARASNRVADALDVIRASIDSPESLALPDSMVRVHLKRYFDAPLERDRILMLSELSSFLVYHPPNANSANYWERNDRVDFQDVGVDTFIRGIGHIVEWTENDEVPWYFATGFGRTWEELADPDDRQGAAFLSRTFKEAFRVEY